MELTISTQDPIERSWLLGFLAADGNIYGPLNHIQASSTDKELMELVLGLIGKGSICERKVRRNERPLWQYRAVSKQLASELSAFGIVPRKGPSLQFPPEGSVNLRAYIRGYWDGDGCWSVDNRSGLLVASIGFASKNFTKQFVDIVRPICGSQARVHQRGTESFWRWHFHGRYAVRFARWLYDDDGPRLRRKWEIASRFMM